MPEQMRNTVLFSGVGVVGAREFAQEGAYLALCARPEGELHRAWHRRP
jgi:hypothetical protein